MEANRTIYSETGLEQINTNGGAKLTRQCDDTWQMECYRRDGSVIVVKLRGEVVRVEEFRPLVDNDCFGA